MVRWFRYPCYDVGCYPWMSSCLFRHHGRTRLFITVAMYPSQNFHRMYCGKTRKVKILRRGSGGFAPPPPPQLTIFQSKKKKTNGRHLTPKCLTKYMTTLLHKVGYLYLTTPICQIKHSDPLSVPGPHMGPYSYDECCKEIMLKLIYYWSDSLSESKNSNTHGNPTACLIKAVKHTCILQAHTK